MWPFDGGATKESDTDRDGFLSYSAEIHALGLGLYDGMKTAKVKPTDMRDNPDVQKEPHYYAGAYVVGTILQFLLLVGIVVLGLPL